MVHIQIIVKMKSNTNNNSIFRILQTLHYHHSITNMQLTIHNHTIV